MAVFDLITLAEFKTLAPKAGAGKDSKLQTLISAASRGFELELGRRLVYRAPPETGESAIINAQPWATGAVTINAQPSSDGRTMAVTFTTATAGVLTITGTVGGVTTTEAFDAANGLKQHGVKFFTAVASAAASSAAGGGTVTVLPSKGYVEYHEPTLVCEPEVILPLEWPVQNINELNEDPTLVYGTTTRLTTSFYRLTHGDGRDSIVRLYASRKTAFLGGQRSVKLVDSAGYFTVANVPQLIKGECARLVTSMFDESESGRVEVASGSGPMGTWARFGQAGITKQMQKNLAAYYRFGYGAETGERDFDREAA